MSSASSLAQAAALAAFTIDWAQFTPGSALLGGLLVGLAVAAFVLLSGRILGVSGIVGGLMSAQAPDRAWRWAFLGGLVSAGAVAAFLWPAGVWGAGPSMPMGTPTGLLVTAGLLVGVGTRYASGCTSGHGVCGLSRLSLRSLVATALFMASAMLTVFLMRHVLA
jgi:uncharacterized membrane protein YedE/YeeE